jgi:uncharacterized membrane protein YhhN
MISLIGWAYCYTDAREVRGKTVFAVGMLFALLGDILLLLKGYFLQGLAAFLVMQWCYLFAFRKDLQKLASASFALICLVLIGGCITILLFNILPYLEDTFLSVALVLYSLSIGLMVWVSFLRKESVSTTSYTLVTIGAILFAISDTLIAWNKFVAPVQASHFWIMSTYMMAQYLITRGFLKTPA